MIRSRRSVLLLAGMLGLSLLSCGREVTGPENGLSYGRNRIAALALEPRFPAIPGANAISDVVPFTQVRITLRRIDGTVAKDTLIDFPAGVDSIALAIDVPLPVTAPDSGLTLGLSLAYLNAAGDTVFSGGPLPVTARPSGGAGSSQTVSIPVAWVPPAGVAPASVLLSPDTGSVVAGTTTTFTAVARDAQGQAMTGIPVFFSSVDTTRARVSAPGNGLVTWRAVRGPARIVATLPNLVADTSIFQVSLPASRLLVVGGDAQSATIGTLLSAPVVLRVTASDSVPVAGIPVTFAVTTGGGTLSAGADTSDAAGLVQTSWTLGALVGAQSITATLSVGGTTQVITATGLAPVPTQVAVTAAPTTAVAGTTLSAVTVEVRDANGVRTPLFTGPVSIALDPAGSGATLAGTATVNAVAGIATFADLSIQRAATGLSLIATSAGLAPDTTATFSITAAAAANLALVSGDAQAGAVTTALAAPLVVRVTDAFANPVAGVTVNWAIVSGGGALGAATSVTDAAGTASTTLTLPSVAGVVTVTATVAGLAGSPVAFAESAVPGTASQLVYTSQTGSGVAGVPLTSGWTIEARDGAGNLVTSFTGPITVALSGGPLGATLGGTTTRNAVGGVATFNDLTVDLAFSAWRLDASSPGLAGAQSSALGITNAAAANLALVSGGGQTASVVTPLPAPFAVRVTDAFTNPVAGVTVNWAIPVGGGALSVATSVTDAAGVATASYTTGNVPVTAIVTATVAGLAGSPVSFSTTVTSGAASQLVFAQQPGSYVAAQTGAPVVIEARDGLGNLAADFTGVVTVSVLSGPAGAVLGVTRVGNAVAGVVTLTDLTFNLAGSYTLGAAATGLASATSNAFTVTAGAPTGIASIGGAGQTGAVSAALADSLAFRVVDALGNPAPGVALTVTISTGGGSVSPATGVTDAAGEFRTRWTLGPALGTQSIIAEVDVQPGLIVAVTAQAVAGPATTLVITSGAIPTVTAGVNVPNVVVEARDAAGNLATSFNTPIWGHVDSSPDGPYPDSVSAVTVAGVAVFDFINFSRAGTYQIRFSAPGLTDVLPNAFAVIAGPAAFVFPDSVAPGDGQSATVNTPLAQPLRAGVHDTEANPIAAVPVVFTVVRGVDTLSVDTVNTDAAGIASFTPNMPTTPGPVQVIVTSAGLSGSGFVFTATATAGAPASLVFVGTIGQQVAGVNLPDLIVEVRDALGNVVTAYNGPVFGRVSTSPQGPSPDSVTVTAVAGVATFTGVNLSAAGDYVLRANLPSGVEGFSNLFTLIAGPAAFVFPDSVASGDGQTGVAGQLLAQPLRAGVHDTEQNPIAGIAVVFTAVRGVDTLSVDTVTTNAAGLASLTPLLPPTPGPLAYIVTSAGLTGSGFPLNVTVTSGAATRLVVTQQPGNTTSGAAIPPVTVVAQDALGNVVGAFTGAIDVVVDSGPVLGWSLGGTQSINATLGAATFGDLTLDRASQYRLRFRAAGLDSAITAPFLVAAGAPAALTAVEGGAQSAPASQALADSLGARLADAFGNPIAGATVTWTAITGGGSIAPPTSVTDVNGVARTAWTLGTSLGAQTAQAQVGALTASFTATATVNDANVTWTGAVSSSWSTGGNWSGGVVPTIGDSVRLAAGTPFAPAVDASGLVVGRLVVANGVTLALDTFPLFVNGTLDVESGAVVTSDSIGGFALLGTGTVRGAMPRLFVQAGAYTLAGALDVAGDLMIMGGSLEIANRAATVGGMLTTTATGALAMTGGGTLDVQGDAVFAGGSTDGLLTSGTLSVRGDFTQGGGSPQAFSASVGHVVRLDGPATQTLTLLNPDTDLVPSCTASCFGTLRSERAAGTGALQVASDIKALGTIVVSGDSLVAAGHGLISAGTPSLTSDVVVAGAVAWQDALIRTAGTFAVDTLVAWGGGSLILGETIPTVVTGSYTITGAHPGAVIVEDGGTVDVVLAATVGGGTGVALATRGTGRIIMQQPSDTLTVNGNVDFGGGTSAGLMSAGVLVIDGDLAVTNPSADAFRAEGTHRTRLVAANPTVRFDRMGGNQFAALDIDATGAMTFDGNATIAGTVRLGPGTSVVGGGLITIGGDLIDSLGTRWQATETFFQANDPIIPHQFLGSLVFLSAATIDTTMSVGGNLEIRSGILDLNGHHVTVGGDFETRASGVLRMASAADTLSVTGIARFRGNPTTGQMTAGVLQLFGGLTQLTNAEAFAPSGSHQTWFRGAANQPVDFANPGTGAGTSHFAAVGFGQTTPGISVVLGTDVYADGMVLTEPAASLRLSSVTARTFVSQGATVNGLVFDNVAWRLVDGGPVTAVDNVSFAGTDAALTALDVIRTGGTVTLTNPTFATTPTTGRYLRAEDPDGAAGGLLTVAVVNPTPATHGGFVQTVNGAIITGWDIGAFVWAGGVSSDFFDPANWLQNAVPGSVDSVVIPATGVTNLPALTASTLMRVLVNDNASPISLDGGAVLNVSERLVLRNDVPGVVCTSGFVDVGQGVTNATARGTLNCNLRAVAVSSVTLDGAVTVGAGFGVSTHGTSQLIVNGQALSVSGTFDSFLSSRLVMTNAADSVDVGDANFTGGATTGLLTAGTLVVRGALLADNTPNSFDASAAHRTRFAPGIGDTVAVTANSGLVSFGQLEVTRPVRLIGDSRVTGNALVTYGAAVVGTGRINILGDFTGTTSTLVAPRAFEIAGVLADTGTFRPDTTIFSGTGQVMPFRVGAAAIPQYQAVRITGDVSVATSGSVDSIAGPLFVEGILALNSASLGDLRIGGDLAVTGAGHLRASSYGPDIRVYGNATFDGADATGDLVAGALWFGGNLTQLATNSPTSLVPDPNFNHFFFRSGTVSFATPATSYLGRTYLQDDAVTTTLLTDLRVNGELYLAGLGTTLRSDVLGAGGSRVVTAGDVYAYSSDFAMRNAALRANFMDVDGLLRFQDFDPTTVQVELTNASGTTFWAGVEFLTTPTGAGRYVRVVDTDNADGLPHTLSVSSSPAIVPAFHGGFAEAVNSAVISGWPELASFTWTGGATNGDWNNPANWSSGVVPTATDSVFVPGALLYNPAIPAGLTLRSLVSARTESPLTLAGTLTITGSLSVTTPAGISCAVGAIQFANPSTTMSVRGRVDCFTRVLDGTLAVVDSLAIIGNDLQVEGTSTLDIGGAVVSVDGPFSTLDSARVRMQDAAGQLDLNSGASFGGGSTAGLLTAGLLQIGGNFTQSGGAESFSASGTHVTQFRGSALQEMTFTSPGAGAGLSHFAHLALGGDVGVQLNSDAFAEGQLRSGVGSGRLLVSAGGATFVSGGASLQSATLQRVQWEIRDGAPIDQIDGIFFTNQDPDVAQLSFVRTSGSATATNLSFDTTPLGGVYVSVADPDGTANGSFVLNLGGMSPTGHGGFIAQLNTATIVGWDAVAPFIWTGAFDTDWNNTANWAGGVVPAATDSVTISAAASVGPDINGATTVRALVNQSSSVAVTLQEQPLTVTERLVTLYGTPGVACSGFPVLTIAPTTSATVAGHLACDVVIGGGGVTTLSDSLLLGRSLRIGGAGQLQVNGQTVRVLDSLVTEASGTLAMTASPSYVDVTRDANFRGGSTSGLLVTGRLRVGGSFRQAVTASAFDASGTTVELRDAFAGAEGTPIVSFADPLSSQFGALAFGDGARALVTPVRVQQNAIFGTTGNVTGTGSLTILGALTDTMTYGASPPTLTLPYLWVEGNFEYRGTINADTIYLGSPVVERALPASILGQRVPYRTLIVGGQRVVTVTSGTDSLVTTGNLIVNSTGTLRVAEAGATAVTLVGDTLRVAPGGNLIMTEAGATLIAQNGANLGGGSTADNGVLRVGGDLRIEPGALTAINAHITELFDGSATLDNFTVTVVDTTAYFSQLRPESGTWTFAGTQADTVFVQTALNLTGNATVNGDAFVKVFGPVQGQTSATLALRHLAYFNDWQFTGTYQVDTLTLFGAGGQPLYARDGNTTPIPYNVVRVVGDVRPIVDPADELVILNSLLIDGGTFHVGTVANGTDSVRVQINGRLTTLNGGVLEMTHAEGRMNVNGDATFGGGSTDGRLTTGVLVLQADFIQGGGAGDAFRPTGAHLTQFSTEGAQAITFANPGPTPGASSFRRLRIQQAPDSRIDLLSDAVVTEQLFETMTAQARIRADAERVLTVGGTNLDSVRFDRVALLVTNGGNVEGMTDLTFDSLPANASQLIIQRDGGAVALDGIVFGVVPDPGYNYLVATDLNTGDADPLTINISGVSPGGHGGHVATGGGAVINGWGVFADATWTGALTNDWGDPGNWAGGVVPDANTNVTIPITSNDPVISDQRTVVGLVLEAGAAITLFPSDTLTVTGNAVVNGTVTVSTPNDESSVLRLAPAGIASLAAPGEIGAKLVIASGTVALVDSVRLTGDFSMGVEITGGTLDLNQRRMDVTGSFRTSGTGQLQMIAAEDSLIVDENMYFGGGSTEGLLTNGTIIVAHDFQQPSGGSPTSFAATGSHLVRFVGAAIDAQVEFATPGATQSRFANVGLDKISGRSVNFFNTPVQIGNIVSNNGPVFVNNAAVTVTGTVAQPVGGAFWDVDATASVSLTGVNATCDGVLFVVNNTPANFAPTACWDPPATEMAWTGLGDGTSWIDANNWSLNRLPIATDSVVIDGSPNVNVNVTSTVAWLIVGQTGSPTLTIANGTTLQVDSAAVTGTTTAMIMDIGSTVTGAGTFNIGGSLDWNGGTMAGTGGTVILPGATAMLASAQTITLDTRTFVVGGTATLGAGGFVSTGSPILSVLAGGQLDFPITADYFTSAGVVTLQNAGTVRKYASSGPVRIEWPIINSGTILLQNGQLDLRNTLTNLPGGVIDVATGTTLFQLGAVTAAGGSSVTIASGGLLRLEGGGVIANPGNHDFAVGSSITGAGTLRTIGADTVTIAGTVDIGSLLTGSGRIELNSADTVNVGGGSYQGGGFFSGSAVVAIGGTFTIAAGNPNGTGTLFIRPGGLLEVTGGGIRGWDIDVAGTWRWGETNLSLLQDPANPGNYPQVNIRSGGVFDIVHAATNFTITGASTVITNNGLIQKSTGTATSTISVSDVLNFTGINVNSLGILTITNGCTQSGPVGGIGTINGIGCIN